MATVLHGWSPFKSQAWTSVLHPFAASPRLTSCPVWGASVWTAQGLGGLTSRLTGRRDATKQRQQDGRRARHCRAVGSVVPNPDPSCLSPWPHPLSSRQGLEGNLGCMARPQGQWGMVWGARTDLLGVQSARVCWGGTWSSCPKGPGQRDLRLCPHTALVSLICPSQLSLPSLSCPTQPPWCPQEPAFRGFSLPPAPH